MGVGANVREQIAVSKAEADLYCWGRGNDLHLAPATLGRAGLGTPLQLLAGHRRKIFGEED